MMAHWRKLVARFGVLTLRERVLVFVGALAGTALVYDALILRPLEMRKVRLAQQIAEARQSIRAADILMKAGESAPNPDAVKRSYREALRNQLAEIDRSMQGLQRGLVPPERMAKLLEEMLTRNRGLQLVNLRTLPVQRFEAPGAAPAAAKPGEDSKSASRDSERAIYQHGVEITLQGTYADLHNYLSQLEKLPSQMFWGRLSVNAEQYPRLRVTLTVQTLSLNKAWLIV